MTTPHCRKAKNIGTTYENAALAQSVEQLTLNHSQNKHKSLMNNITQRARRLAVAVLPPFWRGLVAFIALAMLAIYAAEHRFEYRSIQGAPARIDHWTGKVEFFSGNDWVALY